MQKKTLHMASYALAISLGRGGTSAWIDIHICMSIPAGRWASDETDETDDTLKRLMSTPPRVISDRKLRIVITESSQNLQ